jgi:hypothetical protein
LGETCHNELKPNVWKNLWNAWELLFILLCKQGFIADQYGWESEISNNLWWGYLILNFGKKSVEESMGYVENSVYALI